MLRFRGFQGKTEKFKKLLVGRDRADRRDL